MARVADALYYARLVEEQTRFFIRELLRRPAVGRYRPRNARLDVFVRHQTSDRYILDEIFGVGLYELPAGAKTSLAGVARPCALDLGAHIGLFGAFFLSRFATAHLVKIDVEGSEWAIFGDPRFERIGARVVAFEYHPQGCPEPDPRTAAITLFDRLGYVVEEVDIAHAPAGVGMLWAWRATSGSPV